MSAVNHVPAIFITGVDTGVGKTIVTAAIARHLTSKGLNVGVMKPVETGVHDTTTLGNDGELLRWAASSKDPDQLISPYRFSLPASPHQSAQKDNIHIELDVIKNSFEELKQKKDILLVEGAGGLMVPIMGGFLMADLVSQLETPCMIVTHPGLGTLNHTLLTTFAARTLSIDLCGLIINGMPDAPDEVAEQAPHLLSSFASCDLLGVIKEQKHDSDKQLVESVALGLEKLPTYPWLLRALAL